MKRHWCASCRGKGKIVKMETRLVHGKKRDYAFLIDCPGLLADQMGTGSMPMAGQDRAAGAKEEENG